MTLEELHEHAISLQQALVAAWESALENEDDQEKQGNDSVPLITVPLQAAGDAANDCRLAIEAAMFRASVGRSG